MPFIFIALFLVTFLGGEQVRAETATGVTPLERYWIDTLERKITLTQSGFKLSIRRNSGTGVAGQFIPPDQIHYGSLNGVISSDGKSVDWSDGTQWIAGSALPNVQEYWIDERDRVIEIKQQFGINLIYDFADGNNYSGRFVSPNTFVSNRARGLRGTLSPDGNSIDWTSGSYWTRICSASGKIIYSLSETFPVSATLSLVRATDIGLGTGFATTCNPHPQMTFIPLTYSKGPIIHMFAYLYDLRSLSLSAPNAKKLQQQLFNPPGDGTLCVKFAIRDGNRVQRIMSVGACSL